MTTLLVLPEVYELEFMELVNSKDTIPNNFNKSLITRCEVNKWLSTLVPLYYGQLLQQLLMNHMKVLISVFPQESSPNMEYGNGKATSQRWSCQRCK